MAKITVTDDEGCVFGTVSTEGCNIDNPVSKEMIKNDIMELILAAVEKETYEEGGDVQNGKRKGNT